jgi:hypothetical protein
VRDAHRSEIAEVYVELIQELIERTGEALSSTSPTAK